MNDDIEEIIEPPTQKIRIYAKKKDNTLCTMLYEGTISGLNEILSEPERSIAHVNRKLGSQHPGSIVHPLLGVINGGKNE